MKHLTLIACLAGTLMLTACSGGSDDEEQATADECRGQPYYWPGDGKPSGYYAGCYVNRFGAWVNRYRLRAADAPIAFQVVEPAPLEESNHHAHP